MKNIWWAFNLSAKDFNFSSPNRVEIKNELIEGSLGGERVVDSLGHTWFCARSNSK